MNHIGYCRKVFFHGGWFAAGLGRFQRHYGNKKPPGFRPAVRFDINQLVVTRV
jgi:hypothetical protein